MLCQMTVRTTDAMRQWELSEWTALTMLASLSAGPRTMSDLFRAMQRYQPQHRLADTGREVASWDETAGAEAWCALDLRGQTLVCGGAFETPGLQDAYQPMPDEPYEGFGTVWLDTPCGWLFREASDSWQSELEARATAAAAVLRSDTREVLYGTPLLEFLVDAMLASYRQYQTRDDEGKLQLTRDIHARWLMTPRADLGGRTPRQVLLADRDQIDRDIEHRSQQWTRQGEAPPGLDPSSEAYRFAGYGTIAIITYFDLIRDLMKSGWKLIARRLRTRKSLIDTLSLQRDWWEQQPFEGGGTTAAALVESERKRIPITFTEPFDCDCPICRAQADGTFGPGPAFLMFDGHHLELEDMFAFSLEEDYQLWKSQHASNAGLARFSGSLGLPAEEEDEEHPKEENVASTDLPVVPRSTDDSVWKSSYVDWNQMSLPDFPPQESVWALSFPLAELITDLKERREGQHLVTPLNEAYDALRQSLDLASCRSTARQFADMLERTCEQFPELTPKCADLQSHIDEVVRRIAQTS